MSKPLLILCLILHAFLLVGCSLRNCSRHMDDRISAIGHGSVKVFRPYRNVIGVRVSCERETGYYHFTPCGWRAVIQARVMYFFIVGPREFPDGKISLPVIPEQMDIKNEISLERIEVHGRANIEVGDDGHFQLDVQISGEAGIEEINGQYCGIIESDSRWAERKCDVNAKWDGVGDSIIVLPRL